MRALVALLVSLALGAPARAATLPASWPVVDRGARGGVVYGGPRVDGVGAVYVPGDIAPGHGLRVAFVLAPGDPARLARALALAAIGDQLAWQATTPRFAIVVAAPHGPGAVARAIRFAEHALPLTHAAAGRAVIGLATAGRTALAAVGNPRLQLGAGIAIGQPVPRLRSGRGGLPALPVRVRRFALRAPLLPDPSPLWRRRLMTALADAFSTPSADAAVREAAAVAPSGWTRISAGPDGGTVWQGVIPQPGALGRGRASLVYLPPGARRSARYPALYLLHGLRGSPYSYVGGLRLAAVADGLIHGRQVPPFVAVMPPAGATPQFDGEWTGPWERSLVADVVPWADRHLPLARERGARTVAGFSAGAYGSLDIALRHPGVFGTIESWSGYFSAPHDGSLAGASASERLAHDPSALVRSQAERLRAEGVRVFLSAGRREPRTLAATRKFARELASLGIRHVTHVDAGGHHGSTWRAVLPAGVRYAFAR